MRMACMALWWAWPGSGRDAPKPCATPTISRSAPTASATTSALPRPFWMVSTSVSSPSMGATAAAPAATPPAFIASTTRSTTTVGTSVLAATATVRSPLAPETRRPRWLMASTCSVERSMACTSLPAAASRPA